MRKNAFVSVVNAVHSESGAFIGIRDNDGCDIANVH